MNKKIKLLLATSLIAASTLSLVACKNNTQSTKENSQKQEEVQKTEDSQKDINTTEEKNKDSQKETSEKNKNEDTSKKKLITYYTYDVDKEKLAEHTKSVDEISVENVINSLIDEGVLQKGTKVNTAKVEEKNGVRTLIVDVNDKFVNFNQGSTQETLQLRSFTNSLIKTFKVKQILLTVDGKPYSGGHIAFNKDEMLTFK